MGHDPRLYVRAEYATDDYHLGTLDDGMELDDASLPDPELRNIGDVVLNATDLVKQLSDAADHGHIETVHVIADRYLDVIVGDERGGPSALLDALESAVGSDSLHIIDDVYNEHESLPDADSKSAET